MSCARFSACAEAAEDAEAVEDEAGMGVGVEPEEEGSVEGARPREARFPMALSELPLLDAEGARSRASVPPAAPSASTKFENVNY